MEIIKAADNNLEEVEECSYDSSCYDCYDYPHCSDCFID